VGKVETVTFLRETGLAEDGFPDVYKLRCLILNIPASSASVERSFSTLKRVKSHTRNTQTEGRLSNLLFISVTHLKQENTFADVIETFLKKETRLDLIYK
jgi:hypothetical protein